MLTSLEFSTRSSPQRSLYLSDDRSHWALNSCSSFAQSSCKYQKSTGGKYSALMPHCEGIGIGCRRCSYRKDGTAGKALFYISHEGAFSLGVRAFHGQKSTIINHKGTFNIMNYYVISKFAPSTKLEVLAKFGFDFLFIAFNELLALFWGSELLSFWFNSNFNETVIWALTFDWGSIIEFFVSFRGPGAGSASWIMINVLIAVAQLTKRSWLGELLNWKLSVENHGHLKLFWFWEVWDILWINKYYIKTFSSTSIK